MKRIGFVDTTFRDAQQCLWATRMSTAMMLPIAEKLDRAGFDVAEVMGAVQFDAAIRYLGENPWERLRLLRQHIARTPLQALIRSKCVLGFDLVPDDLSALWAEQLIRNGVKRLIVFDGLHDLGNLSAATHKAHSRSSARAIERTKARWPKGTCSPRSMARARMSTSRPGSTKMAGRLWLDLRSRAWRMASPPTSGR